MQRENLLRALRDLAELYQSGGLTEQEFKSTKKLLLAQMRRISQQSPSERLRRSPSERSRSSSTGSQSPAPSSPRGGLHQSSQRPSPPTIGHAPSTKRRAVKVPLSSRRQAPTSAPAQRSSLSPDRRTAASSPQEQTLGPKNANFEALHSLLNDLEQMHQDGSLDHQTFQTGQKYLLEQLRLEETQPSEVAASSRSASRPLTGTPHITPGPAVHPTLEVGQTLLGRYRLERLLGQGGMGQVFLCYDHVRQGHYALKVIHPHLAQYEDLRQRFLQELQVTERLTHQGIVRTYTLEQDPSSGFLFFTMEFVKGVTLEALLRQAEDAGRVPPLPLNILLSALEELVEILEYAHSKGVIHRDLKPSNIMVGENYHVKLMDFGIAKVLEGTAVSKHTGFGGFVYYMAPEQLRGGGIVSPASDVFSLGVISYQLLTGEIPMGTIEPPSLLWPRLPKAVDTVVLKAMSPRPHQRYPTPRAYWNALLEALSPLLEDISLPSESARPTRPVSLDEVLQKIQKNHPQEAIELSSNAELPTQLAQQLLDDLSEVESAQRRVKEERWQPKTLSIVEESGEPQSSPQHGLYPELDDLAFDGFIDDDFTAELPHADLNLSASMELSLDGSEEELLPPAVTTSSDKLPSALELPPPPPHIEQKIFYAKDQTPLFQLVKIPAGAFLMGSPSDSPVAIDNERPQRTVTLGEYWIARTPLTHAMWYKFVQESGYHREGKDYLRSWQDGAPPAPMLEHPIVDVSIEDLQHFCDFYGLSLPTEAQWEKAARGLEGQLWPWGDHPPTPELCNFRESGIGHTTPVTQYLNAMSPFGLFDCSGNVWEWCADDWNLNWLKEMGESPRDPLFRQKKVNQSSGTQPITYHAIRGGCYRYHAQGVRCAFRFSASAPAPYIGARVVLNE